MHDFLVNLQVYHERKTLFKITYGCGVSDSIISILPLLLLFCRAADFHSSDGVQSSPLVNRRGGHLTKTGKGLGLSVLIITSASNRTRGETQTQIN